MLMTVLEVSEYLQLSGKTILRLAKNGEIPCLKIAKQWRFPKPALDEWISMKVRETNTKKISGESE